jgi:hypothetical protein
MPMDVREQQRRHDDITAISTRCRELSGRFRLTQNAATKLSRKFGKALKTLQSMEILCTNSALHPLLSLLAECANSYQTHFNAISETVIGPLDTFTSGELESLHGYAKVFERSQAALIAAEEKYVSLPALAQRPDKFPTLPQLHTDATNSFFQFISHMQTIECKLRAFIPQIVFFISNASVPIFSNHSKKYLANPSTPKRNTSPHSTPSNQ